MQTLYIRKHILTPDAMHLAMDSLQRAMYINSKYGWKPIGGLCVFRDFIIQAVTNEDDNARWQEWARRDK